MNQHQEEEERPNPGPKEGQATIEALRNLWGKTGRERDFMQTVSEGSGRASMEDIIGHVGYEDLDNFSEGEATKDTYAAGQRLSAAFHKTLEKEGKVVHSGQSMGDLMRSKEKIDDGVSRGNQEQPPWEKDEE